MASHNEHLSTAGSAAPGVALSASGFELDSLIVPTGLPIEEILLSVERQLATLPVEVCIVLSPSGEVVVRVVGTESAVTFTTHQCALAHGGYMTHNHPAGTGLSFLDVLTAHRLNLLQIRAVANSQPACTHVLSRPATGWRVQECEKLCTTEMARVRKKYHISDGLSTEQQRGLVKKASRHLAKFAPRLVTQLHLQPEQRPL